MPARPDRTEPGVRKARRRAELHGLELAAEAEQRILADLRRRLSGRGIYLPVRCCLTLLQRRTEPIVGADGEPLSIVDAKVTAGHR